MHPHRFDCSQTADSVSQLAFSWGKRTLFFFLVISPEHCEVNWSQTTRMLQVTEDCSHNWIPGGFTYYLAISSQYTAGLVRLDATAAPLWHKSVFGITIIDLRIFFLLNFNNWCLIRVKLMAYWWWREPRKRSLSVDFSAPLSLVHKQLYEKLSNDFGVESTSM